MDDRIKWLLEGDVSVQYRTHRLLTGGGRETPDRLRRRIGTEGFGKRLLDARQPSGHWDIWFYQRKWTCTHYTITDLMNLGVPPACEPCREMVTRAFDECLLPNGGVNFSKTLVQSDTCVDGMILSYAAYFCPEDKRIEGLLDFILSVQHGDGGFGGGYGWKPETNVSDAHTTICVLEGFRSYVEAGLRYRLEDTLAAEERGRQYLLENRLFIDGDAKYGKLSYPYRYRYDLLRALEYFTRAGTAADQRLEPALAWLRKKRGADGLWKLENRHPGNEHFIMEETGRPSRFITLRALYILGE